MLITWLLIGVQCILLVLASSQEANILTDLSLQSPDRVIQIKDGNLDLVAGSRDYYTLIVFVSSAAEHKCVTCSDVHNSMSIVAQSWFQHYLDSNELFFIEIDLAYTENFKLAQVIKLNTIPHVWLVPPNNEEIQDPYSIIKEKHFIFKFPRGDIKTQAHALASFITQTLKKPIVLITENPALTFALYFIVTLLSIILFRRRGPVIITNLGKQFAYLIISIGIVLTSTTGFNFVRMNNLPFIAKNENGMIYVTGGTRYQLGVETVLLSSVYTAMSALIVLLIKLGTYKVSEKSYLNDKAKFFTILLTSVVLYILYSILTSIVLRKDPGYPYPFLKLF